MNRRKSLSVILLIGFLMVGFWQEAWAGVDSGAVGSGDSNTVTNSEAIGQKDALTLNKSKLLMKMDDKVKLKAEYITEKADKSLTWKSSDTKVAKVSSKGTITAVNVGTATITCTSKADAGFKATCKVTVVTEATDINISKESVSIDKGSSITLTAAIKPSGAKKQPIIWKSSDKTIATVTEKGVVTGIKKGTVKITATVQYRKKDTVIAACLVTVQEPEANDPSDVEIKSGQGNGNILVKYQYSAGFCYAADGYYTLKVGNYKGDLGVTFQLTNGSDTQIITVEPNSTYYLTYTYSFTEDRGTIRMTPQYTYEWGPVTGSLRQKTTYIYSTVPAIPRDSDLSVSVSGKVCKNTISAAGSFEKGTLNYIKKE